MFHLFRDAGNPTKHAVGSLKTRRNITNDAWMGNHKPIYDALAEL
jgi:hypothetical protein